VNNPLKLSCISNELQAQQGQCDERLEDYLDHLCAPLIGIVPYAERRAFRLEAHTHIAGLIGEYQYQGQELQAATESALREFGEPWKIGQAFLQEWCQGTPCLRPVGLIRKATCVAFALFGIASMLTLLVLEQSLLAPHQDALLLLSGMLAFFSPLLAGCLTGMATPAQAERGVRNAMLLLLLHSFTTGLLLLPKVEGLAFAGWQLLFWLPGGRVSASLTAAWLRHMRRQRFWQIAR